MFYSGGDSARDASGTVLIPTRFVWPYGGTNVSLIGSFTGWTDHWQMSPIEGCPTVFLIVCRLPPGHHQYKFIVDGEWRHDDHQPVVSGSDGAVNTIFLATESDYHSSAQSPRLPSGSNMDVDNENFKRMVRVSENPVQEAVPRLSEADFEVSRYRVSEFLSNHTAYELLPDSGKVIALDIDLPVKQAFHILYEQGIPMASLWDSGRGQFVGVISASDFILILRELGNHGSNLTEEELETHTISAWKEAKLHLSRQMNMAVRPFPAHLIHVGPFDNLKDVALKILQNGVATVPIIHSSLLDGSLPQLLHIASLSGILKCICRYFRHSSASLPILQSPICAIPLGTWVPQFGEPALRQFAMLRPSDSLNSALKLLLQAQVSSIPIVDDHNSLLDIYSRSDIMALAKDRAYTHINLDEMTIHQALQLRQDAYSSFEFTSQRCQMCLRSDPLHKVMERLSIPALWEWLEYPLYTKVIGQKSSWMSTLTFIGVRRLVVVEAGSKRVEGIISLSDVFKFLLS